MSEFATKYDVLALEAQLGAIRSRVDELDGTGGIQIGRGPPPPEDFPFRLYIGGTSESTLKVCMRPGTHLWFNQYTQAVTATALSETGSSSWALASSTIYVKRVRNADDTATVTLVRTTDNVATVLAGVTTNEARFIIGTVSTSDGIVQWRRQVIEELRVS